MVLDTSAVIAILRGEEAWEVLWRAMEADPVRLISCVTALEASIVVRASRGEAANRELETFFREAAVEFRPFDQGQLVLARIAWKNFGKGNHRAALNFGDCCVYALAKMTGEPILCKGRDFALTDIPLAVPGTGQ